MRLWVNCFLAILSISFLAAAPANDVSIPSVGESIDVSIVNVDVVVTDKSGKRVRGLTRADFEVLQDGKAQPISNFAEYGSEAGDATASITTAEQPRVSAAPHQQRTMVVFVDRFTLRPFDREPLFASVRKMLHEIVRPGDAVMIVSWRNRVVTRMPFTDDLAQIDRTLAQIERESTFASPDAMQSIEDERAWLKQVSAFAEEQGFTIDLSEEIPVSGLEAAMRARIEMRDKVRTINALMSAMSGLEGKKVLMLMTHRFSRIVGQEFLIGRDAGPHPRNKHELEHDMLPEIQSVVKTANANGVTIYPFYPEGLGNENMPNSAHTNGATGSFDLMVLNNELEAMSIVAEQTGGVLGWGSKNIVSVLPAVTDDFGTYYSLAYRASGTGDEKARNLVVRVKDRSLKVRARRSFVEKSNETKMKDRVLASLMHDPAPRAIDFDVTFGKPTREAKHRYRLPVLVKVPMGQLMTLPQLGEQTGGFSVYVGWGGVLGELSDVRHETRSFTLERGQEGRTMHLTYEFELLMDEKTDRVAVGVVDEVTGEFGVRRIDLPTRTEMLAEK